MNKLLKYRALLLFLLFIVLVVVYFRPLLIKTTEWYVGDLLKEEVQITSLTLYPLSVDAYINNPDNRVYGIVTNEFPLKADINYSGNLNAFKEYLALDANTTLSAVISYDEELIIEVKGDVVIPAFDTLRLNSKLTMIDDNLSVALHVVFSKNSEYNFDVNVSKEGNNTLVNLQSDAFGGDTEAVYEENKLKVRVKNIHLSKLLKQYKVDLNARGYISAQVAMDVKTFKSSLSIYSSKIRYNKEVFSNVNFDVKSLQYEKEKLDLDYALMLKYNGSNFKVIGDVHYKDKLLLNARTKDLGGQIVFSLQDTELKLKAVDVKIHTLLKLAKQKQYISGLVSLDAEGNFEKIHYALYSKKLTTHKKGLGFNQSFWIKEEGDFDIKKRALTSKYTLNFKQKKQEITLSGLFNYKKSIYLSAKTKLFGAATTFKYVKGRVTLSATDIDVEELLMFVEEPVYARGKFNLHIAGRVDNLGFYLNAQKISLYKNLSSLGDSINLTLKANYTPKRVKFQIHAKANTFQLNKSKGVYYLKNEKLHLEQSLKLLYEGKMIPLFIDLEYVDEVLNIKSPSLGGNIDFELKEEKIKLRMKQLSVDKIVKIINKEAYARSGVVNGNVFYDIKAKKATTNMRVNNMQIKGIDLDTTLGVMGLDIFNITKIILDNKLIKLTRIKHLEMDLDYADEMIHLKDVAFATAKYRIAAIGDIHEDGNITSLDIHILNKKGCSILDQKLTGSIYDIKLDKRLSTTIDIVRSVPKSLLNKTKSILDFATNIVDKKASFIIKESHLNENDITLLSSISQRATGVLSTTVGAVKRECKPIYRGLVKHPLND